MNRLSEKQLLILTIAITVLLTGGLGFLIWSDLKTIEQEEQTTASLRDKIAGAEREIAQIPTRERQVIINREISDKEVAFLPSETQIENFWEVVERFANESGVRISQFTSTNTRKRGKKRGGSTSISSVPQVLTLRATADEFLRFINLLENYDRIINVVEYKLAASRTPDDDGKVRHTIKLALTTFTYSKSVANTIVSIPGYEKKREHPEVKQGLSRIKIQAKESYQLRTSLGRRDPFVNVRKKPITAPEPGVDDEDIEAQEAVLQGLIEEIRTLEYDLGIEDHLRKIGDLFRLAQQVKANRLAYQELDRRIQEVQRREMITARDLQEKFKAQVLDPFIEIGERMKKGPGTQPKLTSAQVKEWHKRVATAFDERDWSEVETLVRDYMTLTKDGTWVDEEARPASLEISEFLHRAKVIQKFEKRQIKISTILYSPRNTSFAIINNKQVTEGDALDAEASVVVVEIGEDYVIFETEGVEIKRWQRGR